LGVSKIRMQLAVNRYVAGDGDQQLMEDLAKHNVSVMLPDDLNAIKSANRRRGLAAPNSAFWQGVVAFTCDLLGTGRTDAPPSSFGFLKKTISSLFGAPAPDTLQTASTSRGGRTV